MRLRSMCLMALTVSLGCSRAQENPGGPPLSVSVTTTAGAFIITIDGVRIEVDKRVECELPVLEMSAEATDGRFSVTQSEWTRHLQIDGEDLLISEGELKIGAYSYGAVSSESAIEVQPEGVLIDGQNRGVLPGARKR